jgi:hypothetical protein
VKVLKNILESYFERAILFDMVLAFVIVLIYYFFPTALDKVLIFQSSLSGDLLSVVLTLLSTLFGFLITVSTILATFRSNFKKDLEKLEGGKDAANKVQSINSKITVDEQLYGTDLFQFIQGSFRESIIECALLMITVLFMVWADLSTIEVESLITVLILFLMCLLYFRSVYLFRLILDSFR